MMQNFDENAEAKKIKDCERLLSDGIILNNLSVLRNPSYLFEKCKKLYGKEAIDIVFAASVLLHRDTADVSIRPSEKLIEWAEKVPMLGGIRSDVQYLRFSLVAPWGANAVKVYSVIRRYVYEFRKDCL